MWVCFSNVTEHYVVSRAILSGFRRHGNQLVQNYSKYKAELDTFCSKTTVLDIIKKAFVTLVFFKAPKLYWRNKYILTWDLKITSMSK